MSGRLLHLLLVALPLGAAQAQDAGSPEPVSSTALPPVDVPVPEAEALPDSSVAAKEPTAVISTVSASARAGEAKQLSELLSPVPGLAVQDGGGMGARQSLVLRGASSTGVTVLLDGVPLAPPGQPVDLSRLSLSTVDSIEVLRGAAGARFGPGGLGGAVNIVSRAPSSHPFLWGEVTQGSFATTLVNTGATSPVGIGDALIAAHFARSDGNWSFLQDETTALPGDALTARVRENNDFLQTGGFARWRGKLGGIGLDARVDVTGGNRGLAGPAENPTADARQQSVRGLGVVRAQKAFEAGGTLELTAFGRGDRDVFKGGGFGAGYRQSNGGLGGELVYSRLFFGWHGVTALVSGGADWLDSDGGRAGWGHGSLMLSDELLFFEGRLTVLAAARLDQSGPFTGFSPRLGAALQLPWNFTLRANAGQAHRPPSFAELYVQQGTLAPNPQLRPERALSGDAALEWKHARASAQVGGFYGLYEDLISYEYYPPMYARPYNFQAATVAGFEAEAALAPWDFLSLSGTYTFLSTQNLKDDERYYLKELPYRPRHKVTGRLEAGPRWLRAHGEVLFQSEQGINRSGVVQLPARSLVAVGATARPFERPDVRLSLEVKNLLDVQGQDLDGYPLPPRAAYLTLAVAWDSAKSVSEAN